MNSKIEKSNNTTRYFNIRDFEISKYRPFYIWLFQMLLPTRIFVSGVENLTFETENVIFSSSLNFYLFYSIVVNFFVNFVHMNVQNFRYIKFFL